MTIPYSFSGDTVTLFLDGAPYPVDRSHPNWDAILKGLNTATEDELLKLVSVRKFIQGLNIGLVTVTEDAILYNGNPVNSHLTQRMLEMLSQGLDVTPWAKFMDNLYRNPSKTAVDELFLWLEKSNMPITDDGHFLAYKKVRDDYLSYYDRKTPNFLNTWTEMPRNQVDDRRHNTCSQGLHFCSWHYLPQYMGDQGRVLVVKINPADVVSIPSDYDNAKGRAWRYYIFGEVERDKAQHAFPGTAFSDTSGAGYWQSDDDSYSYEDEEEEVETNANGYSYEEWQDAVVDGQTKSSFNDYAG